MLSPATSASRRHAGRDAGVTRDAFGRNHRGGKTETEERMASTELLTADEGGTKPDPSDVLGRVSSAPHGQSGVSTGAAPPGEGDCNPARSCHGRCHSAPRTAAVAPPRKGGAEVKHPEEKTRVCCDEELETSFTYIDENVNLRLVSPETACKSVHRTVRNGEPCSETLPELSLISEDDLSLDSTGTSIDYGFISAVTFLVTGISLVIISYAVPRDVAVDHDSVSAREMERLEMESARVGAHLDRCVIAGLCLLTLGGVVLSTLLMISMWKGEMYRRKVIAYSKRSAKLYGSISLKTRSSPSHSSAHLSLEEEIVETLT